MSGIQEAPTSEDAPSASLSIGIKKRKRISKYVKKTDRCFSKNPKERLKRLLSRSIINENGCMEWTGTINKNGYGYAEVFNKYNTVPRHVYALAHGDIPKGMYICHQCDNRKCINPDHLFLGTPQDNVDDCIKKGRNAKGFMIPHTVFDDNLKKDVIKMVNDGMKYQDIADIYKVSHSAISRIAVHYGGIRRHRPNKKNPERIIKALEMIRQGMKYKDISEKLGICDSRVTQIARSNGIFRHNMEKPMNFDMEEL